MIQWTNDGVYTSLKSQGQRFDRRKVEGRAVDYMILVDFLHTGLFDQTESENALKHPTIFFYATLIKP